MPLNTRILLLPSVFLFWSGSRGGQTQGIHCSFKISVMKRRIKVQMKHEFLNVCEDKLPCRDILASPSREYCFYLDLQLLPQHFSYAHMCTHTQTHTLKPRHSHVVSSLSNQKEYQYCHQSQCIKQQTSYFLWKISLKYLEF